jgi:uncharacterized protein (DUF1800 family)
MSLTRDTIDPTWAWQPFRPSAEHEWNRSLAAHLFSRATFGATLEQVEAAVKQEPAFVVEQIISGASESSSDRQKSDEFATTILATGDPQQLAAWWVYVMLATTNPLVERMTLFWHGHFATSAAKVADANLMYAQNQLIRANALGDFRLLVQEISRDPAMLIYLDSATNRKSHPNENYARELMELFCLGEGHYSEKDVQELARCFTGWEIKSRKFRFNRFQHDSGSKTILGKTGHFDDGASIDWILEQSEAPQFIVGKLYRQFVCDEPDPPPELLEPLAIELRERDWQISAVIRRILGSQIFFSAHALGRKVRSPVDLGVGLLRSLDGTTNTHELAAELKRNGQGLLFPPNVKGWDGGRAWINSSTILGRANMMARLIGDAKTRFGGGKLDEYFERLGADKPAQIIDVLITLMLAMPLPSPARDRLVETCGNDANRARGIGKALRALAALPEFQLG